MKLDRLNAPLLVKLLQLDAHAEHLSKLSDAAEAEVALSREYLSGRREDPRVDIVAIGKAFEGQLTEAKRLRAAADAEQRILSSAKLWLEMLPSDSELERVELPIDDLALPDVRARKQAIADELRILRSVPTPSSDIRERVQGYVHGLAHIGRPVVQGVAGGALKVSWPSAADSDRRNLSGFSSERGNALLMLAYAFPDVLVERLMVTVEAETSRPIPPAQRLTRIGELEGELERLDRVIAALVDHAIADGVDEVHDIGATPETILGCRIRVAASAAA